MNLSDSIDLADDLLRAVQNRSPEQAEGFREAAALLIASRTGESRIRFKRITLVDGLPAVTTHTPRAS